MPWTNDLSGMVAVVTGAGSGIGAATARALSRAGARAVLSGRGAESLEGVAAGIRSGGGEARVVPADVRDEGQVRGLIEAAVESFGTVDALINNAGVFHEAGMAEMTAELWDDTLNTNLRGAFLCARAVWPIFTAKRAGHIVNVSSVSGVQAYPRETAYTAAKHGMNGLSAALALDGRQHNIRVSTVCPGATDTPLWQEAGSGVLRRMMRPEDVAEVIRWLVASPPNLAFDPVIVRNLHDPWENQ